MLDGTKAHALRTFLAALLPLGCLLVVCEVQTAECDPAITACGPLQSEPGAQGYEVSVDCDHPEPLDVTVAAGVESDRIVSCSDLADAFDPTADARVDFAVNLNGSSLEAACYYESFDLPQPFECGGTLDLAVIYDSNGFGDGTEPNTLRVGLIPLIYGDGGPSGSLDVAATIACPNNPVLDIPTDGQTEVAFPDLLTVGQQHGECEVAVTLASEADLGTTVHSVTLYARSAPRDCSNTAQCAAGLRCGPAGCQTGDAGQPCLTSFTGVDPDPAQALLPLGDCNETARICTSFGRCSTGAAGVGCRENVDCAAGLHCTSPVFGTCAP